MSVFGNMYIGMYYEAKFHFTTVSFPIGPSKAQKSNAVPYMYIIYIHKYIFICDHPHTVILIYTHSFACCRGHTFSCGGFANLIFSFYLTNSCFIIDQKQDKLIVLKCFV